MPLTDLLDIDDEDIVVLTPKFIMKDVLEDFGISVTQTVAKAIFNELQDRLEEHGYIRRGHENG